MIDHAKIQNNVDALILAAGKSTRMGGTFPKVLLPLGDRKIIDYIIENAKRVGCRKIAIVIGFQADAVRNYLRDREVIFVEQKQQLGTGHAVMVSDSIFSGQQGHLLILNGDVPMLTTKTLNALLSLHFSQQSPTTILTTILDNPTGYGRVIRTRKGLVQKIIEEKDATIEEKGVREVNAGMYVFQKNILFDALQDITCNNESREYYLTDVIETVTSRGLLPHAYCTKNWREVMGINTPEELKLVERLLHDQYNLAK